MLDGFDFGFVYVLWAAGLGQYNVLLQMLWDGLVEPLGLEPLAAEEARLVSV